MPRGITSLQTGICWYVVGKKCKIKSVMGHNFGMKKKFVILFAGAVGSSKTPIAYYLSWNLNLPIFNNDAIRSEIVEDVAIFKDEEYIKRRDNRLDEIIKNGLSFIYDASIDREWSRLRQIVENHDYKFFIISLDLSKEFLASLYKIKGYHETLARIENLVLDHQNFLKQYPEAVGLNISEDQFNNRLELSLKSVKKWLVQK